MQDNTIPVYTWNDTKVLEKYDGDEVGEHHYSLWTLPWKWSEVNLHFRFLANVC